MISINIYFLSLLADIIGKESILVSIDDKSTIKDLLGKLSAIFGKNFQENILESTNSLSKYIIIVLNGKDIRIFQDLNTIIHDGDEISFLPAIAGG
ncbi:MAG: MoaD/ThiS family protein [Candidatus Hodarchaeota archaeon]